MIDIVANHDLLDHFLHLLATDRRFSPDKFPLIDWCSADFANLIQIICNSPLGRPLDAYRHHFSFWLNDWAHVVPPDPMLCRRCEQLVELAMFCVCNGQDISDSIDIHIGPIAIYESESRLHSGLEDLPNLLSIIKKLQIKRVHVSFLPTEMPLSVLKSYSCIPKDARDVALTTLEKLSLFEVNFVRSGHWTNIEHGLQILTGSEVALAEYFKSHGRPQALYVAPHFSVKTADALLTHDILSPLVQPENDENKPPAALIPSVECPFTDAACFLCIAKQ